MAQIDIVCENSVGRVIPAWGEHGFACMVTMPSGRWLFDTGSGRTLLQNLAVLGFKPDEIDGVILSHGHYDHCGGLLSLVQQTGSRKVFAHSGLFAKRYWQGLHEQRDISVPHTREDLEEAGADFIFLDTLTELEAGFFYSGRIPRNTQIETGDPHLVRINDSGCVSPDKFDDDAALAIRSHGGLVVLLGCAHAGLMNTVEHLREQLNEQHVHAIIGGTHLGPASDEQFAATVDYLARLNPDRIGVSHCTGQIRSAQLYARFPNKVFFANVGTSIKV